MRRRIGKAWRGLACAISVSGFALAGDVAKAQIAGNPGLPPLATSRPPDPANGRKIVTDRRKGLCLLCHSGPFPEERFHGDIAPSLAGAGSRWSEAEMRLRIVDSSRVNAESVMPAYFRSEGFTRVGRAWQGRTILTADEIEDVVSFLMTLKE